MCVIPWDVCNFHFKLWDFCWVNCPRSLKVSCWSVWFWMLEILTKPRAVCYFVFRPKVFNSKLSERDLDLGGISHWQILLCYCSVHYSFCPLLLYLGVMDSGEKVSLRQNFCFLSLIQLHYEECQWVFWCGWELQELVVSLSRNLPMLAISHYILKCVFSCFPCGQQDLSLQAKSKWLFPFSISSKMISSICP